MKKNDKASISLIKILGISIALIFITSISVIATNEKLVNVKIILPSGYEMTTITSNTKVEDILKQSHITLLEDEKVTPAIDEKIGDNKTIKISKIGEEEVVIAEKETISEEDILKSYNTIIEKIVVEQVVIPYETITKEATGEGTKQNRVIQTGKDGLKEVTYKVKYQNDEEIERTEINSRIITEPRNKIVEVRTLQVTSRGDVDRDYNPALTAKTALAASVQGIEPIYKVFNTSAYCACMSCCGKTNGITASGEKASAWYTVAAGSGYKMGTVIYIPSLADEPNGGWFVVQDRGGAISNSKLDIFMGSHGEALQYGRRNVEAYVYEF